MPQNTGHNKSPKQCFTQRPFLPAPPITIKRLKHLFAATIVIAAVIITAPPIIPPFSIIVTIFKKRRRKERVMIWWKTLSKKFSLENIIYIPRVLFRNEYHHTLQTVCFKKFILKNISYDFKMYEMFFSNTFHIL